MQVLKKEYDSLSHNSKVIKMITTDIGIDKIEGKDLMADDLRFSNSEPATQNKRSELRKHRIFQLECKTFNT